MRIAGGEHYTVKRNRDKRELAAAKRIKTALDNDSTPQLKVPPLEETMSGFIAEIEELFCHTVASFIYIELEIDEIPGSKPENWFPVLY